MAKYSAEELNSKVNDLEIDDELKISLMEDIKDSINDESEELKSLREEIEKTKSSYEELKTKYKERFLKSDDQEVIEEKEDEELEEKEVVDVKEI